MSVRLQRFIGDISAPSSFHIVSMGMTLVTKNQGNGNVHGHFRTFNTLYEFQLWSEELQTMYIESRTEGKLFGETSY